MLSLSGQSTTWRPARTVNWFPKSFAPAPPGGQSAITFALQHARAAFSPSTMKIGLSASALGRCSVPYSGRSGSFSPLSPFHSGLSGIRQRNVFSPSRRNRPLMATAFPWASQ